MTSMLHVGLMGLTVGTPFVSYRGPGKTKSFLNSIGGEWAILPKKISFVELHSLILSQKKEQLFEKYNLDTVDMMKRDSLEQFNFCTDIVKKWG